MGKMRTIILQTKWSIVIILKNRKSLYLHKTSTNLDEIWFDDASQSPGHHQGREGKAGKEKGRGEGKRKEERASHTAAVLGLTKPIAGSGYNVSI